MWAELWGPALVLARVLPLTVLAPYLGGRFVPMSARVGLGVLLTWVLWSTLPAPSAPTEIVEAVVTVTSELLLGAALGFLAALAVYAALMAGAIIDAARGQRDPEAPDRLGAGVSGPTATLLGLGTVAIFVALDGHHLVLRALYESFERIPLGAVGSVLGGLDVGAWALLDRMGAMIALAVVVSLPVLGALLLANLALGLIGRVAPRFHAFFVGLPLQSVLGLLVLVVALTAVLEVLVGELGAGATWLRTFLDRLGSG